MYAMNTPMHDDTMVIKPANLILFSFVFFFLQCHVLWFETVHDCALLLWKLRIGCKFYELMQLRQSPKSEIAVMMKQIIACDGVRSNKITFGLQFHNFRNEKLKGSLIFKRWNMGQVHVTKQQKFPKAEIDYSTFVRYFICIIKIV